MVGTFRRYVRVCAGVAASADQNIVPFARFIREEMSVDSCQNPTRAKPAAASAEADIGAETPESDPNPEGLDAASPEPPSAAERGRNLAGM